MRSNVALMVNLMILLINFTNSVHDVVTESLLKLKDSILKALREKYFKPQMKCENLEGKLFELQKA